MKKLVCILVSLGTVAVSCSGNDPIGGKRGRRTIAPRLSSARWQPCCERRKPVESCDRKEALELLEVAHGDCLDLALAEVQRHAKEDLSAAYFLRAQRERDPADFLKALTAAEKTLQANPRSKVALFNRALAQEKLGLTDAAIQSWNVVILQNDGWSMEARHRRDALMRIRDRADHWRAELEAALRRRDRTELAHLTGPSPSEAMKYFEESDLLTSDSSRLLAEVLAARGEHYAQAIVDAIARTRDRAALEQGLRELRQARALDNNGQSDVAEKAYERAALLLERAGSPLSLSARYGTAVCRFRTAGPSVALFDSIAIRDGYRDLSYRVHTMRAVALEYDNGRYLEALAAYETALKFARGDATATVNVWNRRSLNYSTMGGPIAAFRNSFDAVTSLPGVSDLNARHQAYASAARATWKLGYPDIALQYQNEALAAIRKGLRGASGLTRAKQHYGIALRGRAELLVELDRDEEAVRDLQEAADLAAAANNKPESALLKMRIHEVSGRILTEKDPAGAVRQFTEAIALASVEDSTHRAVLLYERATAWRSIDGPKADADIAEALKILRAEAKGLLEARERGTYEELWTLYFSRFATMHRDMIQSRIDANDIEGAFVYAEQARAFEPMQLLLQSGPVPPGFRNIETVGDLRRNLATLPDDTVILQYLVLEDKTYTWILTRNRVRLITLNVTRETIERWATDAHSAATENLQTFPFETAMSAAYELVRAPLAAASPHARIVIVPDGPLHALPFNGLKGTKAEGPLIDRASISISGSTSLYFYALQRDRQLSSNRNPAVFIVGDPAIDPALSRQFGLGTLRYAREEAQQLSADYPGAKLLLGADATTQRFLDSAKNATIIHFAGHGVAISASPWNSMLVLAPHGNDAGDLTAEKLLTRVSDLAQTRLVVLGACSTASGQSVGPEGVAPLVRPLIAARVPAVVGTLWDVQDATAKDLLVSLHRHYRHGDDVAVALQQAQREMLRKKEPARKWAPFQVVGYAASPYAHHAALENTQSEHIPRQDPLYRPDGLHSQ